MLLSLIIPAFNEAESLPALVESLEKFTSKLQDINVEVIFVDDHSKDNTPQLLKRICEENHRYKFIRLSKNSGSHIAIIAGLNAAKGDCSVFIAADLQDPPELINSMLIKWREGYHIIWAVRERREGISLMVKLLSYIFFKLLDKLAVVRIPAGADFPLMDKKVVKALCASAGSNPSLGGLIASLGFSFCEVKYTKAERRFGKSKWTLGKKIKASVDAFVAFSYAPMRLMSYTGIICAILGFAYAIFIIIIRIQSQQPIQGWASLMVVVLLIGGIQMTMLGILGEYLWRNLEEARKNPVYYIEAQSDNIEEKEEAKN